VIAVVRAGTPLPQVGDHLVVSAVRFNPRSNQVHIAASYYTSGFQPRTEVILIYQWWVLGYGPNGLVFTVMPPRLD
jgi:hypothetical protein